MVSEEAKAGARGARALAARTYSLAHLKAKLQQRQWGPKWEERDEASWGRAPFEQGGQGGPKVK
jgi:hypothetical protein